MKSKVCNRPECFGWCQQTRYRNSCSVLTDVIEDDCPFYKTKTQVAIERWNMSERAERDDGYKAILTYYGVKFKKRGGKNGGS